MHVTVAICTWNRAGLLAQTLEAMTRLQVPPATNWELLLVNNNCTDETDKVLARFRSRLPLRRCWEPEPGLSHARNRAVREAGGDYLIWTDDDVLVAEDWLAAYCGVFARRPEAAVFGGPVAPWFEGEPPAWLVSAFPRVASLYAAIDLGDRPLPLESEGPLPYGANMAVRMREQRQFAYDPRRGVRQNTRGLGEETFVLQCILKAGATGWWVPEARVRHFIPRRRQTMRFLRAYCFDCGRALAPYLDHAQVPKWFGRPRWVWRRALEAEICFRLKRWLLPSSRWIDDVVCASKMWGMLRAAPGAQG